MTSRVFFFLIKRKQGFLVVSAGLLLKVGCSSWRASLLRLGAGSTVSRGLSWKKAPCPGWASRDLFCPYSKAGCGGISDPCCPGKVENSVFHPQHQKKLLAYVQGGKFIKVVQRQL